MHGPEVGLHNGNMAVMAQRDGSKLTLSIQDDPIFREFSFSRLVLDEIQDADQEVVLDLALISTLHSPGLANLVAIHVNLAKRGKRLSLINLNEHNLRIVKATNLDKLLTIR